jgi:hypothetical protein
MGAPGCRAFLEPSGEMVPSVRVSSRVFAAKKNRVRFNRDASEFL